MKLQFEANQEYQLEAVKAAVDIFKGQADKSGAFSFELDEQTIFENTKTVQRENEIEISEKLEGLNFSLEMETGTGKTYVYLRTIHELNRQYGFKKFIIVVPSLAIKEGVLKNLQITKEHFDIIYEKPVMNCFEFDPKKRSLSKN